MVEAKGFRQTTFSGWYAVNGQRVELDEQRTPFRFACEAGETIEGVFQVAEPGREIVVKVLDYGYSPRKPAAKVWGKRIRFAWAQPGAGPRYLDWDESVKE